MEKMAAKFYGQSRDHHVEEQNHQWRDDVIMSFNFKNIKKAHSKNLF